MNHNTLDHIPYRSRPATRPPTPALVFGTLGIVDQAVRGFMQLPRLQGGAVLPRSTLHDLFQIYLQLESPTSTMAKLRLVSQAGGCVMQLSQELKATATRPMVRPTGTEKAARYYTLASLAAAAVVIPWLLLRKRHDV